uniref:Os01g0778700 protein n=1 Tax=Macrostomum lignano TaxID=282301 RepID=A0A1I8F4T5_9PLAT
AAAVNQSCPDFISFLAARVSWKQMNFQNPAIFSSTLRSPPTILALRPAKIADLPAPPARVCGGKRVVAQSARHSSSVAEFGAGGGGRQRQRSLLHGRRVRQAHGGSVSDSLRSRGSTSSAALPRVGFLNLGKAGGREDSLAVQRQQQTRRAVGGQQPALEHSASSSLAQAEEEGHFAQQLRGGRRGRQHQLAPKEAAAEPTGGTNYESLLPCFAARKAAVWAEISGTGDAHWLEYHRLPLQHSAAPAAHSFRSAPGTPRRSQKRTPPPLLAASY